MSPAAQPYISKSTYFMGRQCPKLPWFRYNAKDQIPAPDEASREFLRVTYGEATDAERRRVRRDLEEYCGLDTLGMVQIVDRLKHLTAHATPPPTSNPTQL